MSLFGSRPIAVSQSHIAPPSVADTPKVPESDAPSSAAPVNFETVGPSDESGAEKIAACTIEFDPHGDVILVVPSVSGVARFHVNSHVLCLASPVFRAMLGVDSRFREREALASRGGANSPPLEISLEDDDPNALAVVLRVLHLQNKWAPKSLHPEKLYQIAVLCDKYDLQDSLHYWLVNWIPEKFEGTIRTDKWLFIAYAFAKKEEFNALSKYLILHSKSDASGNLKIPGGEYTTAYADFDTYVPQHIIDDIGNVRQTAFKLLMDCIHYEIDLYSSSESIKCDQKVEDCDGAYSGLLSRSFRNPKCHAEDFEHRTLTDLHDKLKATKFPAVSLGETGTSTGGCCNNPTQYPNCLAHTADSHTCVSCHTCSNCKTRFKPRLRSGDHGPCTPLPRLHERFDEIIAGITGLEYSRYVRRQGPKDAPDLNDDNLWDCLHYS